MSFDQIVYFLGYGLLFYFATQCSKYIFSKIFTWNNAIGWKKLGDYALITGATDGIGKAIALELGFLGYDLILVGRSDEKLMNTADEFRLIYKNKMLKPDIKYLKLDFDKEENISSTLESQTGNLDIGIVVNNVGIGYPHPMFFEEISDQLISSLINVNLKSVFYVTSWAYKKMVNNKRGMILCIGSGSSNLPSNPLNTVYAAVKGGVEAFCRSLQAEAFEKNITIQCQIPLLVTTKLSKIRRSSIGTPSTQTYAKASIKAMANSCPSLTGSTICPYWFHKLQIFLLSLSPTMCAIYMNYFHKDVRNRAMRKHAQKTL